MLVSPWTRKLGQTKPFSKKCDLLQYCRAFLRPCYLNIHDLVAIKITLLTFHSTKSRIDLLNYQDKLLKFQFNLWNYAEFNAMFLEKPFYSAVKSRGYRGGLKGYYYSSDFSRIGEKTLLLQATLYYCSLWQYGLRSFQTRGTKSERLLRPHRPPLTQFSKFNNFLWVSWFLDKNLTGCCRSSWSRPASLGHVARRQPFGRTFFGAKDTVSRTIHCLFI